MSLEPRPRYVIGVDLGTSSSKAASFGLDGVRLRSGRVAYPTIREASGGVRQRPDDWWSAVLQGLAAAVVPDAECIGLCVCGQIGSYVAVDERFEPLEDAWTWQDDGPSSVLGLLRDSVDLDAVAADLRTWLPVGANWPLPRLLWLREERPDLLDRLSFLAMAKDFVVHRLTGVAGTDPSTWRGLVTPEGAVHESSLQALGLTDVLPPRRPATEAAGRLRDEVADLVGLGRGVPVYLGSSDYACALSGTGVVDEGDSFDIGGTSEHIGTLSVERAFGDGLVVVPYPAAAVPGSYVTYGVTSNGGSVTQWLGSVLLPGVRRSDADAELSTLAAARPSTRRPLHFLPYLGGERSPLWDADACGAWIGLRAEHATSDLVRSAFEGVAFNLRQIREGSPLSRPSQSLRASGGTARSQVWNQIKADILGVPIAVVAELDAAALGAAMHAAVGAEGFSTLPEAIRAMVRTSHVVEPRPERVDSYSESYLQYRALADRLGSPGENPAAGRNTDA
ncbi:MAG: FGGY-family carbohydrate kinase [Propionicimonas sp.]|nr:FGGY-family carbohydrate kinase [Propionicimonas sp.]